MPSHTTASALIKLYHLDFQNSRGMGHPWDWPTWQEITNIRHGLFPSDPALLPKGLTIEDSHDIHSYFTAYNKLTSEELKIRFAVSTKGSSEAPGRKKWATFVSKHWERWKIHNQIVESFRNSSIHPVTVMIRSGSLDAWPASTHYIPKAIDAIALSLFGAECFLDDDSGQEPLLFDYLNGPLTILAQRSWDRIRRHFWNDKGRMEAAQQSAMDAFYGMKSSVLFLSRTGLY